MIIFIGRDYRQGRNGKIVITLQAIAESRQPQRLQQSILGEF